MGVNCPGEVVQGELVRGKCPGSKSPGGNCPEGNFMRGNSPGGECPDTIKLERFIICERSSIYFISYHNFIFQLCHQICKQSK